MIFVTVGTQFGFDRLVRAVDDWLADHPGHDVFGQIGETDYRPKHFEAVPTLDRAAYFERLRASNAVVSHAGMGTIMQCMEERRPLLVMPRRAKFGECINDHQLTMARKLDELHIVNVAYDETQLPAKLEAIEHATPAARAGADRSRLVERVRSFLSGIEAPSIRR